MQGGVLIAIATACSGCEVIFPLDFTSSDGSFDDAPIDATGCMVAELFDRQDAGPCGIGTPFPSDGSGLDRVDNRLAMSPPDGNLTSVSCTFDASTVALDEGTTVTLQVPIVSGEPGTYSNLRITDGTTNTIEVGQRNDGTPQFVLFDGGTAARKDTYLPATMQWWRLRIDATGVVAETSNAGATFLVFGTVAKKLEPPWFVTVETGAFTFNSSNNGTAVVDNLSVCP